MRRVALLAAALFAVSCSTATPTQTPTFTPGPTIAPTQHASPTATPSPGATSSSTPAPLVDAPLPAKVEVELQEALDGYVAEGLVPSLSATVMVPGVGGWSGAAGAADRERAVAATPGTAYAVGSITKTFAAALILRLAEEGFFGLDDPAADHLGPVAASKTNGATIRQLLGHRSGIYNFTDNPDIDKDKPWTVEDLLALVGEPHFAPGERFEYSNTNYLLLGLIAEVVTGGPLGELLHEYLLGPLDLERTYYGASEVVDEPFAHGYLVADGEYHDVYDGSGHVPFASATSAASGAGSISSTTADVGRWLYLLLSGQVLSDNSQRQMLDFGATPSYGLGIGRWPIAPGVVALGHGGSIYGFLSTAAYVRDSGVVIVVFGNADPFDIDGLTRRLYKVIAAAGY